MAAPVRLAIIGCGGMGKNHQYALAALGDRVDMVAAVDVDAERAAGAARQLGCRRAVTDYREVMGDVDAAIVVLPHHLHHPVGLDLLEHGKHVLMEKPLANTEAQCRELIAAAASRSRTLMVAYCMRYHPLVLAMERLLREKTYGECFQLSIWTEQHTQAPPGHWQHTKATLGGGQLFSHGCHYVDILLAWLGEPVEGVHMGNRLGTPWMEGEGTSNVCMRFANGALGYHFGTWGARGSRLRYSFHAHCTDAMIEAQISAGKLIVHHEAREDVPGHEELVAEYEPGKQVGREIAHFVDCIHTGATPLTDAVRSLQSLRVIWRLMAAEEAHTIADLRGLGMA